MFFNLGYVMRDVINHMHVQIIGGRVKLLGKGLYSERERERE